jgi:hypothetical protein
MVAGLVSVATIPVAVYLTRLSDAFDLLHVGLLIPIVIAFAVVALALSRRIRRRTSVSLAGENGTGLATAGHVLGIIGLCVAASALVALGVYGLLEYVGSQG